jgi:hypothetical protein
MHPAYVSLNRLVAWAASEPEREGRSYIVDSPTADLAPSMARIAARREGQASWFGARVLHVERLETGRYEVVLEA